MSQTELEYQDLVKQKMLARAERNTRAHAAEQEALVEEGRMELAAQGRAEQARQKVAEQRRQSEAIMDARRQRPTLLIRYKADPTGIRHVETLQHMCMSCGSEWVQGKTATTRYILVCKECRAEWYVNQCWSCVTGRLDSRDPETPPCEECGRIKCAECGACNVNGCSTNPYNNSHRQRDVGALPRPAPFDWDVELQPDPVPVLEI